MQEENKIKRARKRKQHTNDGDHVLGGLELPERDIDGDTTLALGLQFIEHPGILEGLLAKFFGFLLVAGLLATRFFFPKKKKSFTEEKRVSA